MPLTSNPVRQAAVLAIRSGRLCLVRSSNGKRWVVPKGSIEPGQTPGETALQEAWEEAGLAGPLLRKPVGSYVYEKAAMTCHVVVFILRVTEVADEWPEGGWRLRRWLAPARVLTRVQEPGLRKL